MSEKIGKKCLIDRKYFFHSGKLSALQRQTIVGKSLIFFSLCLLKLVSPLSCCALPVLQKKVLLYLFVEIDPLATLKKAKKKKVNSNQIKKISNTFLFLF